MTIDRCKIIDLPKISDPRGNLTFMKGAIKYPSLFRGSTTSMMCRADLNAAATCHHDFNTIVGDTEIDLEWVTDLGKSFDASGYGFRSQRY